MAHERLTAVDGLGAYEKAFPGVCPVSLRLGGCVCMCSEGGETAVPRPGREWDGESVFIIREREKIIPGGPGRRPL